MTAEALAQVETLNTEPELDTSAALAEISSELFGQGKEGEATPVPGAETSEPSVESPPEVIEVPTNSVATTGELSL